MKNKKKAINLKRALSKPVDKIDQVGAKSHMQKVAGDYHSSKGKIGLIINKALGGRFG